MTRRREQTSATLSLLNTAKVMAESLVLTRLKAFEALKESAGEVERIPVHKGAGGLIDDLVRLLD